jgi:L-methionine (R)-S-oxide reductase
METLDRAAVLAFLRGSPARAPLPSPPLEPAVEVYEIPPISKDGSCSLKGATRPFNVLDELVALGEDSASARRRLASLNAVCRALAKTTGAEWLGVYAKVPASARATAWGGSEAEPNLLKLAYVGAPSRPYFPLTQEFAAHSNNSTVARSGHACIIEDVQHLPDSSPYYVCDGKVRSEMCVPIYSGSEVIGLLDAESFTPGLFTSPDVRAAIFGACEDLGSTRLHSSSSPADSSEPPTGSLAIPAWRMGISDHDISEAMNAIMADVKSHQPLVGDFEPILVLLDEYAENPVFLPKIMSLSEKAESIRRCRGDGNCFYRAAIVSLGEALVRGRVTRRPSPPFSPLQSFYDALCERVKGALGSLVAMGYAQSTTEDFLSSLHSYLLGLSAPGATIESAALAPLRESANDAEGMASFYVIYALRLLTSLELKSKGEEYLPGIMGTSECFTVADFCSEQVEGASVEADQVQILALARWLQVRFRIAYLDASASSSLMEITLPDESEPSGPLALDLLFRPGHYDCLKRK